MRKFGSEMAWKWRELAPFYFSATVTMALIYFCSTATSIVCSSGRVALKVAQVPSTLFMYPLVCTLSGTWFADNLLTCANRKFKYS